MQALGGVLILVGSIGEWVGRAVMARPSHRARTVVTVVLVGVVPAGVAACSSGPERSVGSFCAELEQGASALDEQTAAAGDDLGSQVELIVANIGDFTRLLHRLEERAPDEVRSDMTAAVELWDEQAERAGDAASDPLGSAMSVLVQSVMTAPSIEAVDHFALDNCGRVLFGVVPSGGAGGGGGSASGGAGPGGSRG